MINFKLEIKIIVIAKKMKSRDQLCFFCVCDTRKNSLIGARRLACPEFPALLKEEERKGRTKEKRQGGNDNRARNKCVTGSCLCYLANRVF